MIHVGGFTSTCIYALKTMKICAFDSCYSRNTSVV